MNEFIVIQTLQVFPTGYSSRYYYHCTAQCGFRHRADAVNTQFEEQIKKFTPHPGIVTSAISNLDSLYHDADVYFKRDIVSAIYPQKLEYDGYQFRTTHLNEVIATTFNLDAAFQKEKSRQNGVFSILSAKEVSSRFELL